MDRLPCFAQSLANSLDFRSNVVFRDAKKITEFPTFQASVVLKSPSGQSILLEFVKQAGNQPCMDSKKVFNTDE